MLPNLSAPAFTTAMLCTVRVEPTGEGAVRTVFSDCRRLLRFDDDATLHDARVYFVGADRASSDADAPALIGFLQSDVPRRVGARFELLDGLTSFATGVVHALTTG